MGFDGVPLYGEMDLGSAIEEFDKVMAVVKSNKFDSTDLLKLAKLAEIIKEKAEKLKDNED